MNSLQGTGHTDAFIADVKTILREFGRISFHELQGRLAKRRGFRDGADIIERRWPMSLHFWNDEFFTLMELEQDIEVEYMRKEKTRGVVVATYFKLVANGDTDDG